MRWMDGWDARRKSRVKRRMVVVVVAGRQRQRETTVQWKKKGRGTLSSYLFTSPSFSFFLKGSLLSGRSNRFLFARTDGWGGTLRSDEFSTFKFSNFAPSDNLPKEIKGAGKFRGRLPSYTKNDDCEYLTQEGPSPPSSAPLCFQPTHLLIALFNHPAREPLHLTPEKFGTKSGVRREKGGKEPLSPLSQLISHLLFQRKREGHVRTKEEEEEREVGACCFQEDPARMRRGQRRWDQSGKLRQVRDYRYVHVRCPMVQYSALNGWD